MGQQFGIVAVVLRLAGGDGRNLARIGYDHLVAQRFEQRLTQGECVPHSSAIRCRGSPSKCRGKAISVLCMRPSSITSPSSFNKH